MRVVFAFLLLIQPFLCLFAQDGIAFIDNDWEAALQKARTQDKLIFVDAYADWCAPCKEMDREVFSNASLAAFMNANFINLKMDMENGEGPAIGSRYSVFTYPSFLFINAKGELVHRGLGYLTEWHFRDLAEVALNTDLNLKGLKARFEAGEGDPGFLRDYAYLLYSFSDPQAKEVGEAYLETQDDWLTPENMKWVLLVTESSDHPAFDFFVENIDRFNAYFGVEEVADKVQEIAIESMFADVALAEPAFDRMQSLYEKVYPEKAEELTALFRMNYYSFTGETDAYARAAVDYFDRFGSEDPAELNNAAWKFVEEVEDKKLLKKALEWAVQSVELEPSYYNYDTLAWLYYRLGKRKKARKAVTLAFQMAEVEGEDPAPTQDLLDLINR